MIEIKGKNKNKIALWK